MLGQPRQAFEPSAAVGTVRAETLHARACPRVEDRQVADPTLLPIVIAFTRPSAARTDARPAATEQIDPHLRGRPFPPALETLDRSNPKSFPSAQQAANPDFSPRRH